MLTNVEGQQLRYAGIDSKFDDVIITGNPDELKFIAYYTKGSEVVAVARCVSRADPNFCTFCSIYACSMQNDPVVMKATELMRLGLMPSPEEIKAGKASRAGNRYVFKAS